MILYAIAVALLLATIFTTGFKRFVFGCLLFSYVLLAAGITLGLGQGWNG